MRLFTKLAGGIALASAFALSSCEKEEVDLSIIPVNGMTVTLTPEAGGESQRFTMSTPVVDDAGKEHGAYKREDIRLKANTTYNATVTFFSDESGLSQEQNERIKREEAYYTIKYTEDASSTSSTQTDVDVTITDKKGDGSPLGFQTKFRTGNAGMDAVGIELHASKSEGKSSMAGTVYNATYWIDVQN